KRAQKALGGAEAAAAIHSYRRKGEVTLDVGWVSHSSVEELSLRPNKVRRQFEFRSPLSQSVYKLASGFDGRHGWSAEKDAHPSRLTGKALQDMRREATFLPWYDDPAKSQSAQCLGEVVFNGKPCYAVVFAQKSGDEETHYFDTNTFLPAGVYRTVTS